MLCCSNIWYSENNLLPQLGQFKIMHVLLLNHLQVCTLSYLSNGGLLSFFLCLTSLMLQFWPIFVLFLVKNLQKKCLCHWCTSQVYISGKSPGWAEQKVTSANLSTVEGWENKVGAKIPTMTHKLSQYWCCHFEGRVKRGGSRSTALIGKVDFRLWAVLRGQHWRPPRSASKTRTKTSQRPL